MFGALSEGASDAGGETTVTEPPYPEEAPLMVTVLPTAKPCGELLVARAMVLSPDTAEVTA